MKSSQALLVSCATILLATTTDAFTATPSIRPALKVVSQSTALSSRSLSLLRATATEEDKASIYAAIGIEKDDLAMGINPDEVLEWIGT